MLCAPRDVRDGSWLRENSEIEFANGNFVSTSIILKNKSAGDGCWDKTIEKTILRTFRARTFSRSLGQSRPCGNVCLWAQSGPSPKRRCLWQINVAMFLEATSGSDLTPVKFSILLVLRDHPNLEQVNLAAQVGIDRSNLTEILARMTKDGLVK